MKNLVAYILAGSLLFSCKKADIGGYPSAPPDSGAVAVTSQDRVYTADQSSNTVSVIDPSTDQLLGVIRFGSARPQFLGALL